MKTINKLNQGTTNKLENRKTVQHSSYETGHVSESYHVFMILINDILIDYLSARFSCIF